MENPSPNPLEQRKEQVAATLRKVLERATLRALLRGTGEVMTELSEEKRANLLAPFAEGLARDTEAATEIARQFYLLGVERVHGTLHDSEGIDHEMLDDAVSFHSHEQGK